RTSMRQSMILLLGLLLVSCGRSKSTVSPSVVSDPVTQADPVQISQPQANFQSNVPASLLPPPGASFEFMLTSIGDLSGVAGPVSCQNAMPPGQGWIFAGGQPILGGNGIFYVMMCLFKRVRVDNFSPEYGLSHVTNALSGTHSCASLPPPGF